MADLSGHSGVPLLRVFNSPPQMHRIAHVGASHGDGSRVRGHSSVRNTQGFLESQCGTDTLSLPTLPIDQSKTGQNPKSRGGEVLSTCRGGTPSYSKGHRYSKG